jgi:hypothetical protein
MKMSDIVVCAFGGMLLSYCRIRTHKIEKKRKRKKTKSFSDFFPLQKNHFKMITLFAGIFFIDLFQRFSQ